MFQPIDFSPLESTTNLVHRTTQVWKIKDPQIVKLDSIPEKVNPTKFVLNWQSQNALAQNQVSRIFSTPLNALRRNWTLKPTW